MNVLLYVSGSEKNKIDKSITLIATLTGSLKDMSSITTPTILIEYDDPTAFNYCYIEEFNRYYYVSDVVVIGNNLLEIRLTADVLMSFKDAILSQNVIIDKNTNDYEPYLPDNNLMSKVKTKTDILNFSGGFLESGEFILITAG